MRGWPHYAQQHRQKDERVVETKDDHQEKYLNRKNRILDIPGEDSTYMVIYLKIAHELLGKFVDYFEHIFCAAVFLYFCC